MDANITPHTHELLKTTDSRGYELEGNVTLTVPAAVAEYYFEAAGIQSGPVGGYYSNGARIAWERDEALTIALAVVATYR